MMSTLLLTAMFTSTLRIRLVKSNHGITTSGWLEGWNYRRSHLINGTTKNLDNYPIEIFVNYANGTSYGKNVYCNNHCKQDFGDVRFTADDGVTLLDYWMREKTEENFAIFWVEIPHIPAYPSLTEIYIYYGNPSANTTTNGLATFLYFEDWENFGGDSDNPNWTYWLELVWTGGIRASNVTYFEGHYSGWKSGNSAVKRYDLDLQDVMGEVEILIEDYGLSDSRSSMAVSLERNGFTRLVGYCAEVSTTKYIYRLDGAEQVSSVNLKPVGEWHTYRIASTSSSSKLWVDEELIFSSSDVTHINIAGVGSFCGPDGCKAFWDAWRIRKYVDPEPISHSWSPEFLYELHDMAILNITLSKTVVGEGYSMDINVTVENQANCTECFSLTVYTNATVIDTASNITLFGGDLTTLTFAWRPWLIAKGNYTISANVTLAEYEMDTEDNYLVGGCVLVTFPGDVNGDFRCEGKDNAAVAKAYDTRPGDPKWNPNADINGDYRVEGKDNAVIAKYYDTP